MARALFHFPAVSNLFSTMVHAGMLQIFMVVMAIAERCTRAVPSVQEYPVKKIHVLRRVPATCSNWDKAWAWLTKVDCGTKYRMELVTEPPREIKQYKLQYVCCDGETECKEANSVQTSWFDTTDEKFLAVVLGSTAACVVIIIIIFAITFYTKKTRCHTICDQESHVYASADGDEGHDGNADSEKQQSRQPEDVESEVDHKCCDADYAEICDGRLPRYTDIFKENLDGKEDPFNRASAPPIYSALNSKTYVNSVCRPSAPLDSLDESHVIHLASSAAAEGAGGPHQFHRVVNCHAGRGVAEPGTKYYNVSEKKKKKKRARSSSSHCDVSESESSRRKNHLSVSLEMIGKSLSASETLGKMCETSLRKENRKSAPPGSLDAAAGNAHRVSSSSVICSSSNSACTVIQEAVPTSLHASDKRHVTKTSRDNLEPRPVRKTSRGSDTSPNRQNTQLSDADLSEMRSASRSTSPSKGAIMTCCDSSRVPKFEAVAPQPGEKESLLRSPSCHSGCGDERGFEDCEHCSKYDRLHHRSDPDVASLHIYQCLDDVRRECAELRAASVAPSPGVSPQNGFRVSEEDSDRLPSKCLVLGTVTQC